MQTYLYSTCVDNLTQQTEKYFLSKSLSVAHTLALQSTLYRKILFIKLNVGGVAVNMFWFRSLSSVEQKGEKKPIHSLSENLKRSPNPNSFTV